MAPKKKRKKQIQRRYVDPGKTPMGPRNLGVGTGEPAKVVVETRQIRRARARAEQNNG